MVRKNTYLNIDDSMIERIEDKQNLNNTDPALIVQERESFNLLIEYIKSMDKRYTEVIVLKYYYDIILFTIIVGVCIYEHLECYVTWPCTGYSGVFAHIQFRSFVYNK